MICPSCEKDVDRIRILYTDREMCDRCLLHHEFAMAQADKDRAEARMQEIAEQLRDLEGDDDAQE